MLKAIALWLMVLVAGFSLSITACADDFGAGMGVSVASVGSDGGVPADPGSGQYNGMTAVNTVLSEMYGEGTQLAAPAETESSIAGTVHTAQSGVLPSPYSSPTSEPRGGENTQPIHVESHDIIVLPDAASTPLGPGHDVIKVPSFPSDIPEEINHPKPPATLLPAPALIPDTAAMSQYGIGVTQSFDLGVDTIEFNMADSWATSATEDRFALSKQGESVEFGYADGKLTSVTLGSEAFLAISNSYGKLTASPTTFTVEQEGATTQYTGVYIGNDKGNGIFYSPEVSIAENTGEVNHVVDNVAKGTASVAFGTDGEVLLYDNALNEIRGGLWIDSRTSDNHFETHSPMPRAPDIVAMAPSTQSGLLTARPVPEAKMDQ